ncbi:MAG: glucose-6-phosphate isomerase [Nitrospirota bacterium]|nr:glucose-6-phosphate isomerase [Nitrospirota bacterium]
MIELNFSNMMEEVIGVKGISERRLENLRVKIESAYQQIVQRKWKELEFLDLPFRDTAEIKKMAAEVRDDSDNFLILGIGGSALGPGAIIEALSPLHNLQKSPKVFIYDNVDPRTLKQILELTDLKKTTVNIISKSGSTAETAAAFMILWDEMKKVLGDDAAKRFIATTDPYSGSLRRIAMENKMRTLPINEGIVGRFSVLSPVGLLLCEVIGFDSDELLRGARDMHEKCLIHELWQNPAAMFSALLYLMESEEKRNINVMIPYSDSLKLLSGWFCQLWAESLGKLGMGMTPYPSVGTTDQHSQLQLWMEGPEDKVIVFIKIDDYGADITIPATFQDIEGMSYLSGHKLSELIKAEEESTELAIAKTERPSMTIRMPAIDAYHLGQLFHFFEFATTFTGFLMGINPFNQPGVEEGKNFTYGMMGKKGFASRKSEVEAARQKKVCWKI